MSPLRSMAVKLFLGIFGSTAVLLLVFSYVGMRRTTAIWTHSFEEHAAKTGILIERALRYAMLLNRKDELHASLRNIGSDPAVESLRIYDKNGRIMFSTEPGEVGHRLTQSAEPCAVCHDGSGAAHEVKRGVSRILREPSGREVLARIQPIANEATCSNAHCHEHAPERTILGVLDLRLSVAAIRQSQREARNTVLWAGILLALVSGVGSALFIQRFVRRPVQRLTRGAQRVASGELETRIDVEDPGELRELAENFNDMTAKLRGARERSERWEEELTRAVAEKTESLRRAQDQVSHMEKMASLGKLSATVAHELNNPLAGILVYAKLIQRELNAGAPAAETRTELIRYLDVIRQESSRCGEIVRDMLTFARESRPDPTAQRLSAIVERSVMSVQHRFREPPIEFHSAVTSNDDDLVCDGNQIQQALIALFVNAVEAMPNGGRLEVRSSGDAEQIRIDVADTGLGIPKNVLPHIFEPFVSTKGDEKGVGLGLAVVYGIVRRHGGSIDVHSTSDRGTTFRICLPRRPA